MFTVLKQNGIKSCQTNRKGFSQSGIGWRTSPTNFNFLHFFRGKVGFFLIEKGFFEAWNFFRPRIFGCHFYFPVIVDESIFWPNISNFFSVFVKFASYVRQNVQQIPYLWFLKPTTLLFCVLFLYFLAQKERIVIILGLSLMNLYRCCSAISTHSGFLVFVLEGMEGPFRFCSRIALQILTPIFILFVVLDGKASLKEFMPLCFFVDWVNDSWMVTTEFLVLDNSGAIWLVSHKIKLR